MGVSLVVTEARAVQVGRAASDGADSCVSAALRSESYL